LIERHAVVRKQRGGAFEEVRVDVARDEELALARGLNLADVLSAA